MTDGDIIVIDKVEDDSYDGKDFKKITDKAGNVFNVKYGQGGNLKKKWHLLEEGTAIKLTVGTYNNKPFVKDFEVVKDEFVKQAAEKVQGQVKTERNDSIESQVAFKGMIELIVAGKASTEVAQVTIGWAMTRLNLPSVIVTKVEEINSEANKDNADNQEAQTESTSGQDSGEPKTVSEFLTWLTKNDIKAPRAFLEDEYKIGTGEVLTLKKCQELYKTIKQDKGF